MAWIVAGVIVWLIGIAIVARVLIDQPSPKAVAAIAILWPIVLPVVALIAAIGIAFILFAKGWNHEFRR